MDVNYTVSNTLLLSRTYLPQRIIPREKAVCMIFSDRISTVLEMNDDLLGIIKYERISDFRPVARAYGRVPGDEKGDVLIFSPSVMISSRRNHDGKRDVLFTRLNVYARDQFTCQYCGRMRSIKELNYDHVVPRSVGGRTNWENIVTSCYSCNTKKGGRTPEQAGMKLRKKPYRPSWREVLKNDIVNECVEEMWIPYISVYL
jgi:hypothetical protein